MSGISIETLLLAQKLAGNSGSSAAVESVNGKTGPVSLSAEDVGAIASPSSASVGDFICYTSDGWSAVTLSEWQAGSY